MPVADTSFLVAVFDEEHEKQVGARRKLSAGGLLHVPGVVLGELTTLVRRRANDVGLDGESIARDVLSRLEGLSLFRHAALIAPEAAAQVYDEHRGISYGDAYCIALAVELRENLLTFDARQARVMRALRRSR